jgi:CHAT domain-containing protein
LKKFDKFLVLVIAIFSVQTGVAQIAESDTLAARQFFALGTLFFQNLSFDSSLNYFQRSSEIWLKHQLRKEYVASERNIAECYIRKGMMERALDVVARLDSVIRETEQAYYSDIIRIQVLKSYLLSTNERYDEAMSVLLTLLEKYPELQNEQDENTASVYYILSDIYSRKGDYDSALRYLEMIKTIREKIFGSEHISLSRIYISFGNNYYKMNDVSAALQNFATALHILEINNRAETDDAAYCHLYMMSTLHDMGEYRKAIEHGKRSIELYSSLNLTNHLNVVGALQKLGEIYATLGDLQKAKEYTEQSLAIATSKFPQSITAQAVLYSNLADIYRKSGDREKALEYTLKGIALAEQSYGKEHPQTGFLYELTAGVYVDRNEFRNALGYYDKALTIRLKIGNRDSYGDIVSLYLSIAGVYLNMKQFDSAYASLKSAEILETNSEVKNIPQEALLHQKFGEYYQAKGKYADALVSYRKAAAVLEPTSGISFADRSVKAKEGVYKKELYAVVMHIADLHELLYQRNKRTTDLAQALSYYWTAIDLVDGIRRQYSADGSKFILAEQSRSLYAKTCRTAMRLFDITKNPTYQEQAFLAADRSKANALLEQLFDQEAKHFAGIPDSLLQRENELLASIAFHEIRMQKSPENGENQRELLQKLQAETFDLKAEHQQLVEHLEKQYPHYYELKYADYTLSINEVRGKLGNDDVLIEYISDGSSLYAFAVSQDKLVSSVIPKAEEIDRSVEQFSSSLKKYETEVYHSSGKYLYARLLKPFEKICSGKKRLIIVPDGMLHYVPFEALPARPYQAGTNDFTTVPYLLRFHDVTYSYSAAFTVRMNDGKTFSPVASLHPSLAGERETMSFAGFAPVFRDSVHNGDFLANRSSVEQSGLSELRSITMDGKTFNELKYSEDEVLSISGYFQSHTLPFKNFLHTSATETNFKRFSRDYDIVHVATHGFMNEKNPKLSAILFSQPKEQTEEDDGILYLNEAFALDLKAKLVVLSSCESGVGTLVQGEGMMALTRGLFYAGAKNIIFSLWKVPDKQTYLLMDEFYKQMLSGKSYASSLREAKLKLITSKESAFPSKWSGFVLMGE